MTAPDGRTPILYLAPWVDFGGSDKGTIDWFKWLDRARFAPSLVTTQPSMNRRLAEVIPYAEEVWPLPDLVAGQHMPTFTFDFIVTRGVELLHIMNSRLAYELLPDLATLPKPPKVVVQLHVEEEDRSGYVRLISRRYGNLVDGFSVTSEHLAAAIERYDVPRAKLHVIHTGVDAEREFSPQRVTPVPGLDPDCVHVLYPGRLVPQKDPLLMVEAVRRVAAARGDVRVHVVGEGPLEPALRDRLHEHELERVVQLHPPTRDLAGWYRACDMLLMTSTFEGVPYVAYEAMAMGLPVIAPALPGNVELLRGDGSVLVAPRDDAEQYASAIVTLAGDPGRRAELGERSRTRALEEMSLRRMAQRHEALYEALLETPDTAPGDLPAAAPVPRPREPVRFFRPRAADPLVSVIVPCFNHGRYLPACLDALRAQTHPALEVFVVDDASTDTETLAVLDALEADPQVTVIRMPVNGGPSKARNAALDRIGGRFVLPVDADNILLPRAIELLVEQLQSAGERVGFVYPNPQYFGNRRDYYEAPDYNLHALLEGNFCDTCSLFDADVFTAGLRFAQDIKLGHEDWDLALELAEMGVIGEAAHGPTILYRKSGFTRSDVVEYAPELFGGVAEDRHRGLYGYPDQRGFFGRWAGPAVAIKARWSPGLSIVALTPTEPRGEAGDRLRAHVAGQRCRDFEVVVRSHGEWLAQDGVPPVRRIPVALADSPAAALEDGLRVARAPYILATAGSASELLADPALVEKLLRAMVARPTLRGLVLADVGEAGRYPLRPLGPEETTRANPHAVLFGRHEQPPPERAELYADPATPVASLAAFMAGERFEWRHHPAATGLEAGGGHRSVRLAHPQPRTGGERREREARMERQPAIPALPWDQVRRWTLSPTWTPPESLPLVRHRRVDRDERIITNEDKPPPGYAIEWNLGMVHRFQPPGTAELLESGPHGFAVLPDVDEGAPALRGPRNPRCLGFIEEAAFPLLDPLELAYHPPSRQWILVCGPADPLNEVVERRRTLGFVEAYPNNPRFGEVTLARYGLAPLVRTVDHAARRHRYGTETTPAGMLSLELGALHTQERPGSIPLWIEDDRVLLEPVRRAPAKADLRTAGRWTAAPLTWRDEGPLPPRARAAARRSLDVLGAAVLRRERAGTPSGGAPVGYLWSSGGDGRRAVHLAEHPVTGDQLLTPWPLEARDMGYGRTTQLGWVSTVSHTGSLDAHRVEVPWASRFARSVRRP